MPVVLTINPPAWRHVKCALEVYWSAADLPRPHSQRSSTHFYFLSLCDFQRKVPAPPPSPAALSSHSQITSVHICESAAAREWLPSPPSVRLSHSADGHCWFFFSFIHSDHCRDFWRGHRSRCAKYLSVCSGAPHPPPILSFIHCLNLNFLYRQHFYKLCNHENQNMSLKNTRHP